MIGNLLKTETSQKKTPLKALGKWKTSKNSLVRKFTKLFNLIVLIKQKSFKFISWPNFFEEHHILSQEEGLDG